VLEILVQISMAEFTLTYQHITSVNTWDILCIGCDLFGTKRIKREWVPLEELKALDLDGETMGADDMKATFIYGVIVQQIIKEGYIQVRK